MGGSNLSEKPDHHHISIVGNKEKLKPPTSWSILRMLFVCCQRKYVWVRHELSWSLVSKHVWLQGMRVRGILTQWRLHWIIHPWNGTWTHQEKDISTLQRVILFIHPMLQAEPVQASKEKQSYQTNIFGVTCLSQEKCPWSDTFIYTSYTRWEPKWALQKPK